MPHSTAGKNNMLDAKGITHLSLHDDIPDDTGSNEISGGSYARVAVTMSAASGGSKAASDNPVFDVPAGTVFFQGEWDDDTAGTFLGFAPINGGTVKGVGTAATSDAITSNGHGLVDTDRVFLFSVNGESLPSGLNATTIYFVVSATTDTFKVSLTSGGAAVDITAVGELAFQKVIPETFAAAGQLAVASFSTDLNG